MNPEVIFVFIVLVVINSLFNKNRVQKKQQQRRNVQNQQNQTRQSTATSEKKHQQASSSTKEQRKEPPRQKPRSLLEEVLEQYNISEKKPPSREDQPKPEQKPEKTKQADENVSYHKGYTKKDQPKKSGKKKEGKSPAKPRKSGVEAGELTGDFFEKTSVEKSEIGIEGFDRLLKFDQESLVRGIVMSEVLQKPKSMRKNKAG